MLTRNYDNLHKKRHEKRVVTTEIIQPLTDKKILLVEDMIETGRSLLEAKHYLEKKGAKVKTACLYTMPQSEIKPDYFLKQIEIIPTFPWEKINAS